MGQFTSLDNLSPSELRGIRVIQPTDGNFATVYAENQPCKICKNQKLSIYHSFDVCMACIVKIARTFNSSIEIYQEIPADIRWKVWRKLNICKRKPVRKSEE